MSDEIQWPIDFIDGDFTIIITPKGMTVCRATIVGDASVYAIGGEDYPLHILHSLIKIVSDKEYHVCLDSCTFIGDTPIT